MLYPPSPRSRLSAFEPRASLLDTASTRSWQRERAVAAVAAAEAAEGAGAAGAAGAAEAANAAVTTGAALAGQRTTWSAGPSLAIAVGVSAAVHVVALAWAAQLPVPAAPVAVEAAELVRTVAMDVQLPKAPAPAAVAPPVVEAKVEPPAPVPAVERAAPPPKRRKRVRRAKAAPQAPAPFASPEVAPTPAPAAAPAGPAVPLAPGAGAVAVTAAAEGGAAGEQDGPVAADALPAEHDSAGVGFDLSGYGAAVSRRVAREQRYPQRAVDDELEGHCEVEVRVDRGGAIVDAPRVVRSSGHAVLDREALRMVRAAAPFLQLPDGFGGESAVVTLPITFRLADDDF